jgi:uncharacterized membrane protein YqiK
MEGIVPILSLAGISLIALIIIGIIFSKLYRKATKELSFVRTGLGGQKVIIDGGCVELPIFHNIVPVNMQTLRLEVFRKEKEALITKDRMRVDVTAEFYVRVRPDKESIPVAAQTLGDRTLNKDALKELIEGKFIDALRSVAAEMEMEELHEKRSDFVQKVQGAVEEDLGKNGLELETVSLTSLDQTNKDHLDPNNAFDAQGLTKITETVEANNKKRNDLIRETEIEIARKNLQTKQHNLNIEKEQQEAQLIQQQEIATLTAHQEAEVARQESEQTRLAEETKIENQKKIEQAQIEKEKILETSKINKARSLEESRIEQEKAIKLAEQIRAIEIANKSKEQSKAQAEADKALADAVSAEEAVKTVRQKAEAERKKVIAVIEAEQKAEQERVAVVKAATADLEAAEMKANAIKLEAAAQEEKYRVDAEGKRSLNEAANALSQEIIDLEIKKALIHAAPNIIKEMVKPIENIDSIKIVDLKGMGNLGTSNQSSNSGNGSENGNFAQQAMNAALQYKAQLPFLQDLLKEIGIKGEGEAFSNMLSLSDKENSNMDKTEDSECEEE